MELKTQAYTLNQNLIEMAKMKQKISNFKISSSLHSVSLTEVVKSIQSKEICKAILLTYMETLRVSKFDGCICEFKVYFLHPCI